jgi:hypothetical protein
MRYACCIYWGMRRCLPSGTTFQRGACLGYVGRDRLDRAGCSTSSYRDAQSLEATVSVEEKTMSTAKRIRVRVERLERAALACRVFAAIQYSKVTRFYRVTVPCR